MTDAKTLAYINLHAVLGSIPYLCRLDERARELIKNEKISIGFRVKGGPEGALCFADGKAWFADKCDSCNIILPFSSPEKFNGMIDGTVTPIPSKGLLKVSFLLKKFMPLTDILSSYLRADKDALAGKIANVFNGFLVVHRHKKIPLFYYFSSTPYHSIKRRVRQAFCVNFLTIPRPCFATRGLAFCARACYNKG